MATSDMLRAAAEGMVEEAQPGASQPQASSGHFHGSGAMLIEQRTSHSCALLPPPPHPTQQEDYQQGVAYVHQLRGGHQLDHHQYGPAGAATSSQGCAPLPPMSSSQPINALPPPPPPQSLHTHVSKRLACLLRHEPRGCSFCIDGSAPLDEVGNYLGFHRQSILNAVAEGQHAHRLPRYEVAVVNGVERIRACLRITYKGFDMDWVRWPMQPGAPPIDLQRFPLPPSRSEQARTQRNHAAHQRAILRSRPY